MADIRRVYICVPRRHGMSLLPSWLLTWVWGSNFSTTKFDGKLPDKFQAHLVAK